jgi:HlyD family secretion protein
MDRELPKEVVRGRLARKYLVAATVITLLILAFMGFRALIRPSLDRSRLRTSVAELGRIEATITASGIVVPEFEQVLTSPISTKIDSVFLVTGDHVTLGQPILQLNRESLLLEKKRLQDELELQKTKKQQLSLKLQQSKADLDAQYEIKRLQVQFCDTQLRREKQLYDVGA